MGNFDHDCLIVGGGPAGLTAAIYLARFHLSIRLVDAGKSRAALIPCTRNHAGYPEGIAGTELLRLMTEQARKYGVGIDCGRVTRIGGIEGGFEAEWGGGAVTARSVLLATGVTNRRPPIDEKLHDQALAQGLIRYCPICDGYEVTDKRIGVIGDDRHGVAEAVFLRGFSKHVTLISPDTPLDDLKTQDWAKLAECGIATAHGPVTAIRPEGDTILVQTGGTAHHFDTVYPALGSDVHSSLAKMLGVALSDEGCIKVDAHQRTSVPGVYAAGDVVKGLDQISHAMGEGGVAASAIRNDLARERPLLR